MKIIIMLSFIITLTHQGKPILFRLENTNNMTTHTFEVRALNDEAIPVFTMQHEDREWKIATEVPDTLHLLQPKLHNMIMAYLEGLRGR